MKHAIRLAVLTVAMLLLSGCAWWQKTGKPIVSTVDDVARSMCAMFYGERMGVSPEEALKTYCKLREQWAPWIDPALASMEAGATAKLQAAQPAPASEPAPAAEPPQEPATGPATPEAPTSPPAPETTPQAPPEPATAPSGGGDAQ
jgi:hypothetical protein